MTNVLPQAQPGEPLYDNGLVRVGAGQLVDEFAAAVGNNSLPQVRWRH